MIWAMVLLEGPEEGAHLLQMTANFKQMAIDWMFHQKMKTKDSLLMCHNNRFL